MSRIIIKYFRALNLRFISFLKLKIFLIKNAEKNVNKTTSFQLLKAKQVQNEQKLIRAKSIQRNKQNKIRAVTFVMSLKSL